MVRQDTAGEVEEGTELKQLSFLGGIEKKEVDNRATQG